MQINTKTTGVVSISLIIFFGLSSCSSDRRIKNEKGKYSILVLDDWDYELKNRTIQITKKMKFDSLAVPGTLIVAPGNSDNLTLEELFAAVENDLPYKLVDYHKINEGYTEIDKQPAKWLKLSHSLYGYKYISIRYYLNLNENTPVIIECSSISGTLEEFEPDLNRMAFSFKRE